MKINNNKLNEISVELSKTMERALNSDSYATSKGIHINQAALRIQVKQFLRKDSTVKILKNKLLEAANSIEKDYQRSLYNMLLGTDSHSASRQFRDKVRSMFVPKASSRKTNGWIDRVWGGDWYAYKRSLAGRRLVRTGKKDNLGKDIYRVYAGALRVSNLEADTKQYFDVGQFKAGDRAKKYNKTMRAKAGSVIGSGEYEPGTFDTEALTNRLNPRKIGRRAAKSGVKKAPDYAITRSVILAHQLRQGTHRTIDIQSKGKSGTPKGKIPYARTGQMAKSFAGSFIIDNNSLKVNNVPIGNKNLVVTASAKFNLNSMASEYRRQFLRTPTTYKNLVINSSGSLFSELLQKQLKGK
jgi:hypothetical protein